MNNNANLNEMPAEVIQMIMRRLDTTELLQLTRTNQALGQHALDQLRINHVINLEGRAALIDFANMQAIVPGVRGEHVTISNVRNVNAEARRAVATIMSQPTTQSIHFERVDFLNLVQNPDEVDGMAINTNMRSITLNGGRLSERTRIHYLRVQHAFRESLVVLSVRSLTDTTLTSNLFENRSIYNFLEEFPRATILTFTCNTRHPLIFPALLASLPQLTRLFFRNEATGARRDQLTIPITEAVIPPLREMQLYIRDLSLDMVLFIRDRLPLLQELTLTGRSDPGELLVVIFGLAGRPGPDATTNPVLQTLVLQDNTEANRYMMWLSTLFPLVENLGLHNWWPTPRGEVPLNNNLSVPSWNLQALVLDVSYMFAENFMQAHQNRKAIIITMNQGRRIVRFRFNGHQFVQNERHELEAYLLFIQVVSLGRLHLHYGNNNQTFHDL